jgi:arylsulfatase A-like enzyme
VIAFAVLALLLLAGCQGSQAPPATTIRLVDLYKPEAVEASAGALVAPPRTEWRFDGPGPSPVPPRFAATRGWEAGPGVAELTVRDGKLLGRTTSDFPVLHLERPVDVEDKDLLHEVELRLSASAGANVSIGFRDDERVDLAKVLDAAKSWPWRVTSPILPGDELRTYTLRSPFPVTASEIRHLLIRPTDAAGARFAIESVRLVFRKEHLASVASGVGWQGLSEIYHETLVSRSPETIRLKLRLPARPSLDLSVGTIEDGALRFRVGVRPQGSGADTLLLERTITRPHRWERAPVDLGAFAGQDVVLSLSLAAEKPGTLGFWGSPTVRSLGAAPVPAAAPRAPGVAPQGVILVWMDTLRRDHLSLYGYERATTPVIDRLAAEGTLVRDCVGQASWTKVATPALMTSLYPTTHTVKDFADRLPSSATTLAEVFRAGGYATLSFSSILFTGRFTNLHRGFEEVHEDGSLPDRKSSKTAREFVDRLLPWLDAHREVPFFVFLHVSDPHDPYRPYPPYDTLWADGHKRAEHELQAEHVKTFIADPLLKNFGMPSWAELEKARLDPHAYVAQDRDWYDGSIRGMDAEIGRLVEHLRGLGLEGKTLLVLTGDHGEEFLDHGRMFHGQSVYGELNNLPLVFWRPGAIPKGGVVDRTVETIDIMPTLLEMCRLPVPAQAQGKSLVPLFPWRAQGGSVARADSTPGWSDRAAISEKALTSDHGAPPPRSTESVAIVLGGWKLIHNAQRPAGDPEFELYDHAHDALDQTDVSAEHPDIVARLARELDAWKRQAESARLKPDSASAKTMSKEDLERLRSLGYIQ